MDLCFFNHISESSWSAVPLHQIPQSQHLMNALLNYQPFRAIYAIAALAFEVGRLPLWLLMYIPKSGRQTPEWSYTQALVVRVLASFVHHVAVLRVKTPISLDPGTEGERFVVMQPASRDFYKGPMETIATSLPSEIGATWFPAPLLTAENRCARIVLHVHGGGYVLADGRTMTLGSLANTLIENTSATHVLSPQYRLSTLPASETSNPFPAALQDSLTAYHYLVRTLRVPPGNIVLSGDSAGGNNAIALLRYLTEYGTETGLGLPAACWLWSPWTDPHDNSERIRTNPNYNTDYIPSELLRWAVFAYTGLEGVSVLENEYVSPLRHPFKTGSPIFVNTGGKEISFFDNVAWAEAMNDLAGNNITLDISENAPHDPLVLVNYGFAEAAIASVLRCEQWTRKATAAWTRG